MNEAATAPWILDALLSADTVGNAGVALNYTVNLGDRILCFFVAYSPQFPERPSATEDEKSSAG